MVDGSRAEAHEEAERAIAASLGAGDLGAATTRIIEAYGPEIHGFLVARLGPTEAADVFGDFSLDVWRGLSTYAGQSTVRAWAYAVARNAAARRVKDVARRKAIPLSQARELRDLAEATRTRTAPHLLTENKSALQRLRDELPEEDQMLLVLRVDRQMAWRDLVIAMSDVDEAASLDEEALAREAARLRKRFQLLKQRLKRMAEEAGLLDEA